MYNSHVEGLKLVEYLHLVDWVEYPNNTHSRVSYFNKLESYVMGVCDRWNVLLCKWDVMDRSDVNKNNLFFFKVGFPEFILKY